jgi:hypothetical protein
VHTRRVVRIAVLAVAVLAVATTAVSAAARHGRQGDAEEHEAVAANARSGTGSCGVRALDDGSGHTMIAEIPDPCGVGSGSPLATGIETARDQFDARFDPTDRFQDANVPVTITGVGFFDFQHGQTGVAPNGIELHSVLDVSFAGAKAG